MSMSNEKWLKAAIILINNITNPNEGMTHPWNTGTWNTGTGTCFEEKGIEPQAEMSVAQFFCKFLHFDLVGKNYFTIFAGGKGI